MKWLTNLFKKKATPTIVKTQSIARRRTLLIQDKLYIMISNNKDNLSVGKYLYEQEYLDDNGNIKFTLSIFEDVVTKEVGFSMGKHIAFTEKRLKALSNMHYTDVVELMFHTDDEYECINAPTKDVYIDPLENFEIIMNAIKAGETK